MEDWHWGWVGWGKGVQTDTACSSKTISATHSLLPNSVNSAFLRRSMCVVFLFFFFCSFAIYWCIGLGGLGGGMWGNRSLV